MYINKYEWCEEIIAKQMHTLIAGCSGSGKSVAEHDILFTMLMQSPYKNCWLLIDTKKVELVDFKNAPHCAKYTDDPREIPAILRRVEDVMDARFARMKAKGLKKTNEPTLWIVIDEFYDLMTLIDRRTVKTEVMPVLTRIASAGRAAGVILLVCTQRTTKDILDGMIAANCTVKLGLATVSAQDSRNILGVNGCEKLPDYGKGILRINRNMKEIEIPYTKEEHIHDRIQAWHEMNWKAQ